MAGANNAQMKARGWKAADITRYRASHSGPMSDSALRRAGALPKKNSHAYKALAETIRQNRPAAPAVRPEVARMRQAKANVDALRASRDERRAAMAKRRQRVEHDRETKDINRFLNAESTKKAVARAEDGLGPNQARREAKRSLRDAIASVREARRLSKMARESAANERKHVEDVAARNGWSDAQKRHFAAQRSPVNTHKEEIGSLMARAARLRKTAKDLRDHATTVDRASALMNIVEGTTRSERMLAKKEHGFDPSWLAKARPARRNLPPANAATQRSLQGIAARMLASRKTTQARKDLPPHIQTAYAVMDLAGKAPKGYGRVSAFMGSATKKVKVTAETDGFFVHKPKGTANHEVVHKGTGLAMAHFDSHDAAKSYMTGISKSGKGTIDRAMRGDARAKKAIQKHLAAHKTKELKNKNPHIQDLIAERMGVNANKRRADGDRIYAELAAKYS